MCGIVGCILKDKQKSVAPILLECVENLDYRGYDSVGIATFDGSIHVKKDKGKIPEVDEKLDLADMPGNFGIAHVRWPSTGIASKENAHPQLDESDSIAVVHNGSLKNYDELKGELIADGFKFKSTTDTEVIPHLIRKYMNEGLDLEHAFRKTIERLDGSYAIAVISKEESNKILATRYQSPLKIGISDDAYFISSDIPAIINYTRKIILPAEGEMVILDEDGVHVHDEDGNEIEKEILVIPWTAQMASKGDHPYYMIKEILEQPDAVEFTLGERENIQRIVDDLGDIKNICFVACGTSYHASLTGKYLLQHLAKIKTDVVLASEFKYTADTLDKDTLVVFISQSGETLDSMNALRIAKETSPTLAIVNNIGSSMTEEAKYTIITQAGPEKGVAATKTYIAQLTAIYLFAGLLANDEKLINELYNVPGYIREVLKKSSEIEVLSKRYSFADDLFYLGRGFSYPIALEGALKLKEISLIHAEGYASGELKHGPLALINHKIPVIVILPPGSDYEDTMVNLEEVKARKAIILSICAEGDAKAECKSRDVFTVNSKVSETIAPLVYTVPLQLLAYYVTLEKVA
ncbi:glucosamine-fructose-6-phosphate aminotransferase GlmS1 [Methanobrevibacter ruminantium M1]|uniref:Glutamine--fructose-6-phosphate aminotransferase [isomerizing] n=1 Tax=Methanobrevibacter ruminantium (strain ATCC 35063 / DSM 1093 / JCM 13430 / OCM 146 / M1) TaxID=634498 RepID=D3E3N2_METRM|nr:glucosamine-fructose-6-phosphate aminotransferase GlmS1 [Methanobrevibacter ruminantium M1]